MKNVSFEFTCFQVHFCKSSKTLFVVLRQETDAAREKLLIHMFSSAVNKQFNASYAVVTLSCLPCLSNGKIDKEGLRQMARECRAAETDPPTPQPTPKPEPEDGEVASADPELDIPLGHDCAPVTEMCSPVGHD